MGFRWGFEWGKVGSGALMVLIGGSISFVLYFGAGSFNLWAAGTTVVGLFTMISGLVGEEGVW